MTQKSGQTLIELLIAFVVISFGLFAAAGLIFSNLNLVDRDQDEVISVNLAREGVEFAKEMRDSNWLAGKSFDAGFADPNDASHLSYAAVPAWDPADPACISAQTDVACPSPQFVFGAKPIDFSDPLANIVLTPANVYENAAAGVVGAATPYQRLLIFHPICMNQATNPYTYTILDSGDCPGSTTKAGVRVESHVRSNQKIQHDFSVYEDLYDWR